MAHFELRNRLNSLHVVYGIKQQKIKEKEKRKYEVCLCDATNSVARMVWPEIGVNVILLYAKEIDRCNIYLSSSGQDDAVDAVTELSLYPTGYYPKSFVTKERPKSKLRERITDSHCTHTRTHSVCDSKAKKKNYQKNTLQFAGLESKYHIQ